MAELVLLPPTSAFEARGKLFRKEVLRAGTYQHPVQPWDEPLVLGNDDIEQLAANSNAAIEAGVKSWVPKTHSHDPEDNRGYVRRFETAPSKEPGRLSLIAVMDIRNPKTADRIARGEIEDVSVGIDEYGDHRGQEFGPRIEHVALVPDPVFAGQDSFVALSRRAGLNPSRVKVLAHRSHPMLKTKRARLGVITPPPVVKRRLSVSAPARKVAKALGITAPESGRFTQESFDAFCESVAEKMSATGPTGDAGAVKCLSRSATSDFTDLHAERETRIVNTVKELVAKGRVPKSVEADVTALLSVRHGYALSAKGEATAVDVRATFEKILAAIPEDAVTPLKERLKKMSIADGQPPMEPTDFDTTAETKRRLGILKSQGTKIVE